MFSTSTPLIPTIALLISFTVIFFLTQSIFPFGHHPSPPIPLDDELDDLSLFHRATHRSAGKSRLGATNLQPKIAFLFLTNTDLYFFPLWELFFQNHSSLYNIYIHADPSVKITPPTGVFQGRLISSKKTYRGTATLISAARRLLATAILDDSTNFYFALISQHCIPLHSFNFVYNSLFNSNSNDPTAFDNLSFIQILSNESILWDRYNARGKNVMVPEVPFDKFRAGSQFFILTRRHSLMVLRDQRLWRKFKIPCINVYSCYPEEHYFPTLLSMEDPKGCSFYTLTRVNWTGMVDGHPHTYYPPEVSPQLIYNLRESNSSNSYLFARKFSLDCLNPLMDLWDKVISRD